jgi:endonuclease/exonuclease/phosphatase family metal-dependent hydrolase
MNRTRSISNVGFAVMMCWGCGGTGEGADEPLRPDSVLTYNVYLGANIADTLRADTMTELAERVERAHTQFMANDFTQRAAVIADRIGEENPSLVGLQEMVAVYVQPVGDRLEGGETPAQDLVIDFQEVLLAELQGRGLDYRVAARVENSDIEVPSASGEDIRVIDHDVIIVRGDIVVTDTKSERYIARLPLPMPDRKSTIELIRGYVAVDVTLQGTSTLFVNTHLEVSGAEPVQLAQATELLAWLAPQSEPVILVGDFNSEGDPGESSATYDVIEEAGYTDAWKLRADPSVPGFTCCQDGNLRSPESHLDRRIDFVWFLGSLPSGTPDVNTVGDLLVDRTPSEMWPSDHAGVVASFSR